MDHLTHAPHHRARKQERREEKNAESVTNKTNADGLNIIADSIGIRMLFCVMHHPMGAKTHIPPGEKNKRKFSVGGSLHTTRSIAHIFVEVVFNVSSHLYNFCCGSDGM